MESVLARICRTAQLTNALSCFSANEIDKLERQLAERVTEFFVQVVMKQLRLSASVGSRNLGISVLALMNASSFAFHDVVRKELFFATNLNNLTSSTCPKTRSRTVRIIENKDKNDDNSNNNKWSYREWRRAQRALTPYARATLPILHRKGRGHLSTFSRT
jgi:hypothetical protein